MIEIKNLCYTYSNGETFERKALKDINITIKDGEVCGLIGHTGSGKTTFAQVLAGLLTPTSGEVIIDGQKAFDKKNPIKKGKIGMVFQYPEYQLFEETVIKDVAFGPKNQGLNERDAEEKAKEALKTVGIKEELFLKSPFELSGGQKRKVALAGILAMSPDILILDEPTAGLDPRGRDNILKEIKSLREMFGITVILISHSMEDIAKVCNRVIVINDGEIILSESTNEVFERADILRKSGLDIPEICSLLKKLKENGIDVNTNIYTPEGAKVEILKAAGKEHKNV